MPLTLHMANDNELLLCAVTRVCWLVADKMETGPERGGTAKEKKKPNYVILCVIKIDFYLIPTSGCEYTCETHLHLSLIIVEHAYSVMYGDGYDVAKRKEVSSQAFLPCNLITVETRRLFLFFPRALPLSHYVIRYGRWKLINFSCDVVSVGGTQWNSYRVVDPEMFPARRLHKITIQRRGWKHHKSLNSTSGASAKPFTIPFFHFLVHSGD